MKTTLSKRSYFRESVSILAIFVFWGAVLPFTLIDVVADINAFSLGERQIIWLITGTALTAIYVLYRRKKYFEKEVWSLNKGVLSRGEPVNTRFELSSIESIVFGVPKLKFVLFLQGLFSRSPETLTYGNVLTLKFNDGRYLVLDILQHDGGSEILSQILETQKDKIKDDYIFTEEEKRVLKLRSANGVLRV
ncbi:MAG: Unknown protein [uncultured Sulfurovum sp.]|nr:MAG: Unknown protein [uncultured Sulfurovum sp.]